MINIIQYTLHVISTSYYQHPLHFIQSRTYRIILHSYYTTSHYILEPCDNTLLHFITLKYTHTHTTPAYTAVAPLNDSTSHPCHTRTHPSLHCTNTSKLRSSHQCTSPHHTTIQHNTRTGPHTPPYHTINITTATPQYTHTSLLHAFLLFLIQEGTNFSCSVLQGGKID